MLNALHLGHHRAGERSSGEVTSAGTEGAPCDASVSAAARELTGKAISGAHPFSLSATPEAFWKARAKGRTALRMLGWPDDAGALAVLTSLVDNALAGLPPGEGGPIGVVVAVTPSRELLIDVFPAEPDRCTARDAERTGATVSWFPGRRDVPTARAVLPRPDRRRHCFPDHFDQGPFDA